MADPKIPLCILINNLWVGGAERLVVDQLAHWGEHEYDLHLVTLIPYGQIRRDLRSELPPWVTVHEFTFSSVFDLRSWRALLRTMRQIRPRTTISHLYFSNLVTRILKVLGCGPVITFEHNTYVDRPWRQRLMNRLLSTITDRIVAVSPSVREYLVEREHIDPRRISVIPNGIPISGFSPDAAIRKKKREELGVPDDEMLVLSIGRIVPQKGYDDLLRTAAILRAQGGQRFRFFVAGGPDKEAGSMNEEAHAQDLSSGVRFLGDRQDRADLLRAADVFFMPSRWEGFGIALLEALAAGTPCVVRNIEPLSGMVGDDAGFCGAGPEEFADYLVRLRDPQLRTLQGASGREIASRFSIEHNVSMIIELERSVALITQRA